MTIDQHRIQAKLDQQYQEKLSYLRSLDDRQLLSLFHGLTEEITLAQYRMEMEKVQSAYADFSEVKPLILQRMAERNTVHNADQL